MGNKLSMKVCSLDKKPICELWDNTPYRVRNIVETKSINEIVGITFDVPCNNPKWKNISNESLILFNNEYYIVKNLDFNHTNDNKLILSVESKHLSNILAEQLISLPEIEPMNIVDLMKVALCYDSDGNPTLGWSLGTISMGVDHVKMRGLEAGEQSPFSFIMSIMEKYNAIPIFNSQTMTVDVIPQTEQDHPTLDLRVSKNLKEVNITYDTTEMVTKLYCYGATGEDGNELDIMSVNPTGLPYITNYDYFLARGYTQKFIDNHLPLFTKTNIYRESSIYDAQDLYDNSMAELSKVSQPKVNVQIQALNTTRIRSNNIVNIDLGDCVLVHDDDLGMDFICNVTKKTIEYEQPHLLNVELVNAIEYKDTLSELFNSVNTVNNVIHTGAFGDTWKGNVSVSDIKDLNLYYLTAEQIAAKYVTAENLQTNYLTAEQIKAVYIDAESIASTYATVGSLEAIEAQIKDLNVDTINGKLAEFDKLFADNADFHKLFASDAEIEELKAEDVTVTGKLKASLAEIDTIKATYVQVGSFEAYKATVEKLYATNAEIGNLKAQYIDALAIETDSAKIEQLEAAIAKIETLEASMANVETLVSKTIITDDLQTSQATIDNLNTKLANIETAIIDIAKVENLEAANAQIENLNAEYINAVKVDVDELNAKSATIEQLTAYTLKSEFGEFQNLTAENLKAANASIGSLDANVANINTVLAGNVGTGLLQTIHLTGENVVIDDAVIKSANIESIDTDVVTVGNENIILSGSTQQFKDSDGNVRVQIGQDAEGDFTFIIADQDGATVIDADGVTEKAIPDGLIKDKMVADDAGIQASKVNYIDKDGNKTLQTVIETEQGRIETLIKETSIENEDGTTTTLKDAFSQTVETVKGYDTIIYDVETEVDTLTGKVRDMNSQITEIKATANGIITQVSEIDMTNRNYIRNSKTMIFSTYGFVINPQEEFVGDELNYLTDDNGDMFIY